MDNFFWKILNPWVGPWEKVSENIDHPYCAIFVTNLS